MSYLGCSALVGVHVWIMLPCLHLRMSLQEFKIWYMIGYAMRAS